MYEYEVKCVNKIIDGDTLDVTVDLGFEIQHRIRVRLYGINTPEEGPKDWEGKRRGLDAKERLRELILSSFLDHHTLILQTKERGEYGRYLGTLLRRSSVIKKGEEPELDLNQQLLEEGYAVEYFSKLW